MAGHLISEFVLTYYLDFGNTIRQSLTQNICTEISIKENTFEYIVYVMVVISVHCWCWKPLLMQLTENKIMKSVKHKYGCHDRSALHNSQR